LRLCAGAEVSRLRLHPSAFPSCRSNMPPRRAGSVSDRRSILRSLTLPAHRSVLSLIFIDLELHPVARLQPLAFLRDEQDRLDVAVPFLFRVLDADDLDLVQHPVADTDHRLQP